MLVLGRLALLSGFTSRAGVYKLQGFGACGISGIGNVRREFQGLFRERVSVAIPKP